jgi:beta-glucanase (GH16 family)
MLRAKFPVTAGMYVEMRAKLTTGIGAWPAFWLEPGVENDNGTFSDLPWPPELDIFEFFNWKWRPHTTAMTGNYQTNHHPENFGKPHDLWTKFNSKGEYAPGSDFSADYHVFALDWRENQPIWVVDGQPVKQTYYEWHAPPAHILVTNQIGIAFDDMSGMSADESQWDYSIDYIRVWQEVSVPNPPSNLATH